MACERYGKRRRPIVVFRLNATGGKSPRKKRRKHDRKNLLYFFFFRVFAKRGNYFGFEFIYILNLSIKLFNSLTCIPNRL